jgi:uroporphyrinogen-III synthase
MARQSRQGAEPTILLTRPEAGADRFSAQLRARLGQGIRIVASPLLTARWLAPDLPGGPWGAVIFTSETAVGAFRALGPPPLPAFCVGDRTAAAAQAAGFAAQSADGDVTALIGMMGQRPPAGPLLYARGRDSTGDLANRLTALGFPVTELVVYEQVATPLSPRAAQLMAGQSPVIAPIFSPRTAALLARDAALRERTAPLWVAALSAAVATALAPAKPERMVCAARPDAGAMLGAVAGLLAAPP